LYVQNRTVELKHKSRGSSLQDDVSKEKLLDFTVWFLKPTDEFSDLPLRVAEITKEQRLRRESQYQENRGSTVITNGGGK